MLKAGALILLAALAAAPSIPPSQSHQAQGQTQSNQVAQHHESETAIDNRGTSLQPLIVKVPRSKEEAAEHSAEAQEQQNAAVRENIVVSLTAVLTFATVALAVFTYLLFRATAEALRDARDSVRIANAALEHSRLASKRQLRAYVSATPLSAALRRDNATISVSVPLKNCGQTPAFELRCRAGIVVRPVPIPIDESVPVERGLQHLPFFLKAEDVGKPDPTFVIYPGSTSISNPVETLTLEDLQNIAAGWGIYVSGRCEYLDAFGDEQWMEFSAVLKPADFIDWRERAVAEPQRKSVNARFMFTPHNNRASFI